MSSKKQYIKELVVAVGIAALFLAATYLVMNVHIPITSEKAKLQLFEVARQRFFPEEPSNMTDSVIMIDTHYDQQFVMEHELGDLPTPTGQVPVADRTKLLRCLRYLQSRDDYRYIMLDIFLDEAVRQDADSTLYSTIAQMRDICIARPQDLPLADTCLTAKAGSVQYKMALWENDFVKYAYMADNGKSMPLKMYNELTGNTIHQHGLIYIDQALARNTLILTFNNVDLRERTYLGGLDEYSIEEILNDLDTKGKYILVGDFEDDLHRTFQGDTPGILINFNAYLALMAGQHRITCGIIIFLLTMFTLPIHIKLTRNRIPRYLWANVTDRFHRLATWIKKTIPQFLRILTDKLVNRIASSVIWIFVKRMGNGVVSSWVGYPLYLTFMCWICYVCFNEAYDILITTFLFYVLNIAVDSYFEKKK